jgi:parallel beta-helix repeat protein
MKKLFIILFISIAATVMGGCQSLVDFFPFLNCAPIIISEPVITATEDQLYSYQVEASDPNGDNLTYFLVLCPEGMSINSENGLISWTPTNDQVGIHLITVETSDGKQSDTQNFEIEVFNVNNPPQIFSYSPANLNFKINEGNSVKLEVQAHDIDFNTTLTYQWLLNGRKVSSSAVSGDDSKSSWIYYASYGDYSQKIVKALVSDGELQSYVQWKITINDVTPPAQPTLNTITSPTNISPQILSGTKETNTSIWINGIEAVPLDSSNKWSYHFTLIEGENNISITSCDAVGNESAAVKNSITLDTISPKTPTLHDVISPTNSCTQLLSGTKEINSSIWINGIEVISVNSETIWSDDFELTEGENSISIISKDTIGNESNEINITIILDISAPTIPGFNTITSPTNISPQILSGTKETNTSIWINGIEVVPFNSSVNWSYSYNLSEGNNDISITSRDAAGNKSASITTTVILDTSTPEAPTLNAVVSPTNISSQILSGNKETDTSIWINGTEIISVNSDITWLYTFDLFEGNNSISITSRDAAGNESSAITATIEYDPNIYVDAAANVSGIEDGTQTHPFDTITEGIEAVVSGKSVIVAAGIYNEQLIINKGITLQGVSRDNTFITGSSLTENLISLEADNITISGFTIDGDSSTSVGIYFDSYSFININNNLIKNNKDYGISYISSAPIIEGNNIEKNSSSGIKVATNGAGIIRNNSIVSNKYGILTYGDSSPEITRNNINNNSNTGIYCRESATPIISYNTISNNTAFGILIANILVNSVNPDIGGGDGGSDGKNKITGNHTHGVSNETNRKIYAKYNWWGDAAGPKNPNNSIAVNAGLSSDWAYWSETGGNIIFDLFLITEP